jgi:hypothetical protein
MNTETQAASPGATFSASPVLTGQKIGIVNLGTIAASAEIGPDPRGDKAMTDSYGNLIEGGPAGAAAHVAIVSDMRALDDAIRVKSGNQQSLASLMRMMAHQFLGITI